MSNYLYIPEQLSKSIYEISNPIFFTSELFCYRLDLSQTTHLYIDQRLEHPLKIAQARVERKNEYLCGRVLAQAVLNHHFGLDQPITSMHEPLPIWPTHVLGSISHSQNKLIVALSNNAVYLGIDIEHWVTSEFAQESAHLILTPSEFDLWKSKAAKFFDFAGYVSLIFSIKESLYKAVYPTAKQYIDFLEASIVDINFENQTLTLTFLPEIQQRYQLLEQYEGGWTIEKDHIITWIFQARIFA
ncbi:4'-phosphopantetheinyl transferase superfamily protein [Acinetobacter oleivorans]|uniref:4'-phosphopantetheinyl transferase family protein n=1 Tax=Acinetobacter oleivorans TaxID=1148157 RepID=UPI0019004759|nr:4'-phosphopantetheinyl transferase superfamily protein [Acinetobacter oleivorans]MBJ9739743.1 4'-phosphopantetheinyl transferase superfamily protein [Acinetobacter oleivorans]MCU4409743.1 4'-phosphopantetheinyl transferase superfamily protein [Acinetobacter oleivorans]